MSAIAAFLLVIFLLALYFIYSEVEKAKRGIKKLATSCDNIPKPQCLDDPVCSVETQSNGQNAGQPGYNVQWLCDYYKMDPRLTLEPQNGAHTEYNSKDDALNKCSTLRAHRGTIVDPVCGFGAMTPESLNNESGSLNYTDLGDDKKDIISGFKLLAADPKFDVFKRFLNIDSSRVFGLSSNPNNYFSYPAQSIEDCELACGQSYTLEDGRTFSSCYGYVFSPADRTCKVYRIPEGVAVEPSIKFVRNIETSP